MSATFTLMADPQHREVLATEVDTLTKESHQGGDAGQSSGWVLLTVLPHSQEGWEAGADLGFEGAEQVFEAPTLQNVDCQAVLQGDWFATIDLEDAYFQIPIWEGHRRYLQFAFNGRTFEFCFLPFGISLAPRTFRRCMDAVLGPLRREGIRIQNYLDDWLVCARSEVQCSRAVTWLRQHLEYLDLRLNKKKSRLHPTQSTKFLGMWLDTRAGTP